MKNKIYLATAVLWSALAVAEAEIVRAPGPCGAPECDYVWPKLSEINGWKHDRRNSLKYKSNILVQAGKDYDSETSTINAAYINAGEYPSLDALITFFSNYKEEAKGMKVSAIEPMLTADGIELRAFQHESGPDGVWEVYAYGEEGGFYLLFNTSSFSQEDMLLAEAALRSLVSEYVISE